jgi:hypothetical protein
MGLHPGEPVNHKCSAGKGKWPGIECFKSGVKHHFRRLSRYIRKRMLHRWVLRSKDEHFCLAAALQLKNQAMLRQMAMEAGKTSIRKEAAAQVERQSFLAAIALNAWDIELGQEVVARIDNELLLRRVAGSARQDAVRLAAARKLGQPELMKKIAFATADISLRWEAARFLNDPDLMADVALFKPGHAHLDDFRQQAQAALLEYLDELEQQHNVNGLLAFILLQEHLPFKLQAFLRLPAEAVQASLLHHMSRKTFSYVEEPIVDQMLTKIEAAGWSLIHEVRWIACSHCQGKGVLALKTVCSAQSRYDSEIMECPDCKGFGQVACRMVTCAGWGGRWFEFKLPRSIPHPQPANTEDASKPAMCLS